MKKQISLIIALAVESLVLILILIVLLVGVLGIFLPILPGLFLIGAAAAVYSLIVKGNYGKITPLIHRRLIKVRDKILKLKITKNFMGVVKKIKKRNPFGLAQGRQEKAKEQILKHGLILFGFNTALVLAFFFGFIGLSVLGTLLNLQGIFLAFIPLLVIFLFAGSSAVVWYRFGQILGVHFKKRKVVNSAFVVLISILPLLVILVLFSGIISLAGGFSNQLLAVTFLGLVLMSILAAVFELLIVSLGVMTIVK